MLCSIYITHIFNGKFDQKKQHNTSICNTQVGGPSIFPEITIRFCYLGYHFLVSCVIFAHLKTDKYVISSLIHLYFIYFILFLCFLYFHHFLLGHEEWTYCNSDFVSICDCLMQSKYQPNFHVHSWLYTNYCYKEANVCQPCVTQDSCCRTCIQMFFPLPSV